MAGTGEVTRLIARIREGDRASFDRLFALVYEELKSRAHWQLAGPARGQTLDTTALVHEAYAKLAGAAALDWNDRAHFFRVASRAMRQIVVDRARQRIAQKRGGGLAARDVDPDRIHAGDMAPGLGVGPDPHERADELLALDQALSRLEQWNERLGQVVELRFFGGLSVEETARALDVSERTVKRDWRMARAFLHGELSDAGP